MMEDRVIEKVVSKFWEKVSDLSWDDWCGMSSKDKEEIVPEVFSELDDITLDIDEVYDLFWDWESGLEESSFIDFN
jgi:hypothetical protein